VRQAGNVKLLTDNTGGTSSGTLVAPSSSQAAIANNIAALNAQINQIITALRVAGIMA
jgi:hypothetical protein